MKNLAELIKGNKDLSNFEANVVSIGISVSGKKVITTSLLFKKEDGFRLKNDGITMRCDNLTDLFLDNKENREALKRIIASA